MFQGRSLHGWGGSGRRVEGQTLEAPLRLGQRFPDVTLHVPLGERSTARHYWPHNQGRERTTVESLTEAESTPPIIIQRTRGLSALQLHALWEYRELLYFLVWRDVKVRYKQTALGVI